MTGAVGIVWGGESERRRGGRALLSTLALASWAYGHHGSGLARLSGWLGYGELAAVLLALAALGLRERGGWARLVATVALAGWFVPPLTGHWLGPGRALFFSCGLVICLAYLWPHPRLEAYDRGRPVTWRQSSLVAALVALVGGGARWFDPAPLTLVQAVALTGLYVLALLWSEAAWRRQLGLRGAALWSALALSAAPVAEALLGGRGHALAPLGLLAPVFALIDCSLQALARQVARRTHLSEPTWLDISLVHPSRILVLSFALLCALGSLMLALPLADSAGVGIAWLDAAFTAVSATCVTGLIVLDTPTAFSTAGQALLLGLIQVGGLGIMVFSAAALVVMGRRLSLTHEAAAADLLGASSRADLTEAFRWIVRVTVVTEAAAAVMLSVGFAARGEPLSTALWRGLFTAVSAFCNAGFALQSDSLVPYADSWWIIGTVAVTILVGGLGPAVVAGLIAWPRRRSLTLHARLVLWATGLLLVVPALIILGIEWDRTLGAMPLDEKILNALFQSVTLRTAGFNSIDLAAIHPVTWTTMILVMFVGGSPGSTAGGVKTTTVAVVLLAMIAVVRGRRQVTVFRRRLPAALVHRATAVTTLGVLCCAAALAALQLTQNLRLDHLLYEVVSALATVGVSMGATARLDEVGKVLIMACMFAGRVGPLSLFVFLSHQGRGAELAAFPEETVPIG